MKLEPADSEGRQVPPLHSKLLFRQGLRDRSQNVPVNELAEQTHLKRLGPVSRQVAAFKHGLYVSQNEVAF